MADASLDTRRLIRRLAYLLRHGARERGLAMDEGGWVSVAAVVALLNDGPGGGLNGDALSVERIAGFIHGLAADRFELEGGRVRARYGHSIPGLAFARSDTPPEVLFHGTRYSLVERLREVGLQPMGRSHVHLSSDFTYAKRVARASGPEWAVLRIRAGEAARSGSTFYRASAHVWLSGGIASRFIDFDDRDETDDDIARRLTGEHGEPRRIRLTPPPGGG